MSRGVEQAFISKFVKETARHLRLEATSSQVAELPPTSKEIERINRQLQGLEKKDRVGRGEEVARILNEGLAKRIRALESVLLATLKVDDRIAFSSLRLSPDYPDFIPDPALASASPAPQLESFLAGVVAPSGLSRLVPGAQRRHEEEIAAAGAKYRAALDSWRASDRERQEQIAAARSLHEKKRAEHLWSVASRNEEVDRFENSYLARDAGAVAAYCIMVLERSEYPTGFLSRARLSYLTDVRTAQIELQLPGIEIVPEAGEFRFVKSRGVVEAKPRKIKERKEIFARLIAACTLRTVHEIFESDTPKFIETVRFKGFINEIDPATGREQPVTVVSVLANRDQFEQFDLSRVDVVACIESLPDSPQPKMLDISPIGPPSR